MRRRPLPPRYVDGDALPREELVLQLAELDAEEARALEVDLAAVADPAAAVVEPRLVQVEERVDPALADVERRQVRQEVVADEEAHEDKVVDHLCIHPAHFIIG